MKIKPFCERGIKVLFKTSIVPEYELLNYLAVKLDLLSWKPVTFPIKCQAILELSVMIVFKIDKSFLEELFLLINHVPSSTTT